MYNEQRLVSLVVDDDPNILEFIEDVLSSASCDVRTAKDGEHALQQANACRPDLVFLDICIPEQDGWLVCSKLKLQSNAPRVVLMTGYADDETADFANFVDADEVLKKPFSEEDVLRVLNEAYLTVSPRKTLQV